MLNAMIYIRGHKTDYNNWAAEGNLGWDYASVLPYFRRSENIQIDNLRNSSYHSVGGPLPVSSFQEFPQIMQANIYIFFKCTDLKKLNTLWHQHMFEKIYQ